MIGKELAYSVQAAGAGDEHFRAQRLDHSGR
jgi:hypothetical protein